MRFIIFSRGDKNTEAGVMPEPQAFVAMNEYLEEMHKAGVLRVAEGLHPTSKGAMVKVSGGKVKITDGPFAEAKEVIGGFTILEVKSRDEVFEWIKRWPAMGTAAETELEVRQLFDADDFSENFAPEQRAREDRMRAELAERSQTK
jgi:hypothetical protein